MDKSSAVASNHFLSSCLSSFEGRLAVDDSSPITDDSIPLYLGGGSRHDDIGRYATTSGRKSESLRVVSAAMDAHALGEGGVI